MRIKILKSFGHQGQKFVKDELRIVDDSTGDYFCRAGWAEDLDGIVPTGDPGPTDIVLEVQQIVENTMIPEVNNA
jgi:hypothetical protein